MGKCEADKGSLEFGWQGIDSPPLLDELRLLKETSRMAYLRQRNMIRLSPGAALAKLLATMSTNALAT